MELKQKYTRFRAYQLKQPGSLFSYYDGSSFTLIEAFITKDCLDSLKEELKICKVGEKGYIDCLHLTSWDKDHCDKNSLKEILRVLKPKRIEYPGYPISDIENQKESVRIINEYLREMKAKGTSVVAKGINPTYIKTLQTYTKWKYSNILFGNLKNFEQANDNSTIKLFRTGSFTVLSLGDIDHEDVKNHLLGSWLVKNEVDVLLIAHHGSDNNVNTMDFFESVKPTLVVCSSDYDNQYEHPRDVVRKRLNDLSIPFKTTKNGDVIVESTGDNTSNFSVQDLISDGTQQRGQKINYKSKRAKHHHKKKSEEDLLRALKAAIDNGNFK